MKTRLDKALHDNGFGTRSSIKKMLQKRKLLVNGTRITDGSFKIEETDEISIEDKILELKKYIYIMLNKKKGLCYFNKRPKIQNRYGASSI